jgi:hypothetical protein
VGRDRPDFLAAGSGPPKGGPLARNLRGEWIWAATLTTSLVATASLVSWGHARWDIENHGFKELVNGWYADHVYRHQANAIEAFLLTTFVTYNLFHAFLTRNLQPPLRRGRTQIFWARMMAEEPYGNLAILTRGPRLPVSKPTVPDSWVSPYPTDLPSPRRDQARLLAFLKLAPPAHTRSTRKERRESTPSSK